MIVYQTKHQIYSEMDYAPENLGLEKLRLDFEEKDFCLDKEDFTCYVPGSMTLFELDRILEKHGFLFNYSGIANHNISRLLAEKNSAALNSLVLGLDLYHSDQSISKTGGKVIKNVSGYDLSKIYLGSYNSFAIITGAYLRLEKLPAFKNTIKVYQELDSTSIETINNTDFYKFIFDLCIAGFDDSCNAEINIYKTENKFKVFTEITCFAETSILDLRAKKIKEKIQHFFASHEVLEHRETFTKQYQEEKNILQISTKLDELYKVIELLINSDLCSNFKIFPKAAMVEIFHTENLLKLITEEVSEPINIRILPVNRENLLMSKHYQKTNAYEDTLLTQLKNKFDPQGVLNPGIL